MSILFPTWKQFRDWKIPSKASFLGLWVSIITGLGGIVIGIYFGYQSNRLQIGSIKTGDQSPVVFGDKTTITYGVSQAVVENLRQTESLINKELERLLKTLDEKDVSPGRSCTTCIALE